MVPGLVQDHPFQESINGLSNKIRRLANNALPLDLHFSPFFAWCVKFTAQATSH
jgi:hypothetical protein